MLLRHRVTGDIYAYHKVLADSGEYDIYEEPKPVSVSEQLVAQKARPKKRAAINNGDAHGTDAK